MAQVKQADVWDDARIVREGSVIIEYVRTFYVVGILQASAALAEAVEAVGIPKPWDEHPIIGKDLRAIGFECSPAGPDTIKVSVRYLNVARITYRGGAGLQETQTDRDLNGTVVTVINVNKDPEKPEEAEEREQAGVITYLAPDPVWTATRIMPALAFPDGIDPQQHADLYVGKTNENFWLGGDAGQWLCENITYDEEGLGGCAWNVTYEFRKKVGRGEKGAATGWDPETIWIDRETSQPGINLDAEGRKIVPRYERVNFDALGLVKPPP